MRENLQIIKRLYKSYTAKHYKKIIWAVFFSILVAGSTSSIAYLLDPAIEKIFIDQDVKLMYLIPLVRTSRAITVCTLLPNNPLLSVAISEIASFIVPFIYNYPNDIFNSAFLFAYY